MVHGGTDHDIDVLAFHDLAEVVFVFCLRPIFGGLRELACIDIAQSDDLTEARSILQVAATHAAATDESDSRLIVFEFRRLRFGLSPAFFEKPIGKRTRGGNAYRCSEKASSAGMERHAHGMISLVSGTSNMLSCATAGRPQENRQ